MPNQMSRVWGLQCTRIGVERVQCFFFLATTYSREILRRDKFLLSFSQKHSTGASRFTPELLRWKAARQEMEQLQLLALFSVD